MVVWGLLLYAMMLSSLLPHSAPLFSLPNFWNRTNVLGPTDPYLLPPNRILRRQNLFQPPPIPRNIFLCTGSGTNVSRNLVFQYHASGNFTSGSGGSAAECEVY